MNTATDEPTLPDLDSLPDRLIWDRKFDAARLQQDYRALVPHLPQPHYFFYNVVPLRGASTSAGGKGAPAMGDYSDPGAFDWEDSGLMEHCPYIKEVANSFDAEVTQVRLMRLEAGAEVKEHRDPTLDAHHQSVIRLTVPILSNDEITFLLNDTPVPMQPGEVWYLKLSDRHAVLNDSPEERVNMSIDLVYNDTVEENLLRLAGGQS